MIRRRIQFPTAVNRSFGSAITWCLLVRVLASSGSSSSSSNSAPAGPPSVGGGSEFIGRWIWHNGYDVLEISQESGVWVVKDASGVGHDYETNQTYSAQYVNGQLVIDPVGPITYLSSSDTILYGGLEYTRS